MSIAAHVRVTIVSVKYRSLNNRCKLSPTMNDKMDMQTMRPHTHILERFDIKSVQLMSKKFYIAVDQTQLELLQHIHFVLTKVVYQIVRQIVEYAQLIISCFQTFTLPIFSIV